MATHELKTDPLVFDASHRGIRHYEIRLNDRNYQVGDVLILKETQHSGEEMRQGLPLVYTGRILTREVTHILAGTDADYGLDDDWVILSLAETRLNPKEAV